MQNLFIKGRPGQEAAESDTFTQTKMNSTILLSINIIWRVLAWCETTRVLSVSLCLFAPKPLSFLHMFFDTSIPPISHLFFPPFTDLAALFPVFFTSACFGHWRGGALTLSANWRLVTWHATIDMIQFCAKMLTCSRNYEEIVFSFSKVKLLKGTNQVRTLMSLVAPFWICIFSVLGHSNLT